LTAVNGNLVKPIILGSIAGIVAGLFGVGGGVVVVPGLVLWFGLAQRTASGTSAAAIVATSAAAVVSFGLSGSVDWRVAGLILIGSAVGAWIGAWLADRLNERVLAVAFSILLLIAGVRMVL
jgi:uncharacterized membrane protein YfcA